MTGCLILVDRLRSSGEPRTKIEDSFWISSGSPEDIESPPSGKRLRVRYRNGDLLNVQFLTLDSLAAFQQRYEVIPMDRFGLEFPATAVEVEVIVGGTTYAFGPRRTSLPGMVIDGAFLRGGGRAAISLT